MRFLIASLALIAVLSLGNIAMPVIALAQWLARRPTGGSGCCRRAAVRFPGAHPARVRATPGRARDRQRSDARLRGGNDHSILDTASPNLTDQRSSRGPPFRDCLALQ